MEDFEDWKANHIANLKHDLEYYERKIEKIKMELKVYEV